MVIRKQSFCPSGKVNPDQHFFVSPVEWNKEHLLSRLLLPNQFVSFVAPSQTGKTTRVHTLIKQLCPEKDVFPIYVDLSLYEPLMGRSLFEQFVEMIKNNIELITAQKMAIAPTNWQQLFAKDMSDKWYFGKDVILLIDEVDILARVPQEERESFLTNMRAHKQASFPTCLRSCLIVTNWVGSYMNDTLGASPFIISSRITAPYFSLNDVRQLFQQYIQQENAKIDDRIIETIYEQTSGAPGLVAMYGESLDKFRVRLNRDPTYSEWFTFCNSRPFFDMIEQYPNYRKMTQYMHREDIQIVLMKKLYKKILPTTIPEDLYRTNILKIDKEYANPFVQLMVANQFNSIPESPDYYPVPYKGDHIDFLKIIIDSITYINQAEILGATPRKSNKCNNKAPPGPKEIVYILAFRRAIEYLLNNLCNVVLAAEEDVGKLSCDMIVNLLSEKIAVEHGANLIVSRTNHQRDSVNHHVKAQAEKYHDGLKANQTWVINWTTVPNGNDATSVEYYFPKSNHVNVVYVYHDLLFTKIQVVSENNSQTIERAHRFIDRLRTGESRTKRPRISYDLDSRMTSTSNFNVKDWISGVLGESCSEEELDVLVLAFTKAEYDTPDAIRNLSDEQFNEITKFHNGSVKTARKKKIMAASMRL